MKEVSAAAVAAPANASFSGVVPPWPREPMMQTKTAVTAAPSIASQMYWSAEVRLR